MKEIIELINNYWKFDNNQQHASNWHDKQDLLEKLRRMEINNLVLSQAEYKEFLKHKSKKVMFELGGGIGVKISCQKENGKWVDITDYSNW